MNSQISELYTINYIYTIYIYYIFIKKREKSIQHKFHKDFSEHNELYEKRKVASKRASANNVVENSGHIRYLNMVYDLTIVNTYTQ